MNKVLPFGSMVILTHPDMFGFCGRDLHPGPEDVGFHGVIVENLFFTSHADDDGCGRVTENVVPGTLLREGDDWCDEVCYTVMAPDGKKLELMGHEIEVVDSLVKLLVA